VKRPLNESCWRRGTSVHPTPTSLLPLPAIAAQSLEKYHRSAGEHLKSSTKELQPVSQLHQGPNLNASMQTHAAWGTRGVKRHAHACRTMILLVSQRRGCMVPRTGVLEWKDAGSFGRPGRQTRRACCILCQ